MRAANMRGACTAYQFLAKALQRGEAAPKCHKPVACSGGMGATVPPSALCRAHACFSSVSYLQAGERGWLLTLLQASETIKPSKAQQTGNRPQPPPPAARGHDRRGAGAALHQVALEQRPREGVAVGRQQRVHHQSALGDAPRLEGQRVAGGWMDAGGPQGNKGAAARGRRARGAGPSITKLKLHSTTTPIKPQQHPR